MMRRRPSRTLGVRAEVGPAPRRRGADGVLAEVLQVAGASPARSTATGWVAELDWRTLVLGVVSRNVEEQVVVGIGDGDVHLRCAAEGTHGAHATAAAVTIAVAAATLLLTRQLLPAATTLVGGLLLVDVTRELALTALERRLARLAADLATALWPGRPPRVEVLRIPAGIDG